MTDTTTTTRTDPLLALADRVEAGESARALSAEIWPAAGCVLGEFDPGDGDVYRWWEWPGGPRVTHWDLSSLDAVSAFTEAVLPGWRPWLIGQHPDGTWRVVLGPMTPTDEPSNDVMSDRAPTLCQAWLAAALRALAMEADRG